MLYVGECLYKAAQIILAARLPLAKPAAPPDKRASRWVRSSKALHAAPHLRKRKQRLPPARSSCWK